MFLAQRTDGNCALLSFAIANDQQVRDFRERMFAHLVVDLLIAEIASHANTSGFKLGDGLLAIIVSVGRDRRDHSLHRCKPYRHAPGIVFDQDPDEALVRSEDRAVQHDRAMFGAILADVGCIKALWQNAVRLDRAHLPCATDCIGQMPFELGRVESAFARQFLPAIFFGCHARFDHGIAQLLLRLVPILIRTKSLFRPQRELDVIGEAEILVDTVS